MLRYKLITMFKEIKYTCADCGLRCFLEPPVCQQCGSNIFIVESD